MLLVGSDRTPHIEESGLFVLIGCGLLGTRRLISICRIAISRDSFDIVLPKPNLSGDGTGFPDELCGGGRILSCFGGTNFHMFTISTIMVPITTGLTSSLSFE